MSTSFSPTPEQREEVRLLDKVERPMVDKIIAQYQRGLLTVPEFGEAVLTIRGQVIEIRQAHRLGRHANADYADLYYWASVGCVECLVVVEDRR